MTEQFAQKEEAIKKQVEQEVMAKLRYEDQQKQIRLAAMRESE